VVVALRVVHNLGVDLLKIEDVPKAAINLQQQRQWHWPVCLHRSVLLRVIRAVTFTTESLGSPVTAAVRITLPGIDAKSVLDVITTATTVANRLFFCTPLLR